jgi:hypothetical protein
MAYPCDAGAKLWPLRPTQDSFARQIGNSRNLLSNKLEQMMTLSILFIGARHSEFEYQ